VVETSNPATNERFERARERIADAYRHRPVATPPVVVGDCNYWITGEDPDRIPGDYFEAGGFDSMRRFQEEKIASHVARIDDDYVPFLFPWYGTGVVPSALGSRIIFQRGEEPAIEGPILTSPADVRLLEPPDPARDGLMPRVLGCIDRLRATSTLPVSFTDCQGPLNIALSVAGVEQLCLWMYDAPSAVHELMDFSTTVLIDWLEVQKAHAGQALESGAFPHAMVLPDGFGGVWISDDDCTILSAPLYREFVVPYNGRVLSHFGGGTLHFCGNAPHQVANFLATDGLVGINNWCMGEFASVRDMQDAFEGRVVLMVCDTTPLDPDAYFRELFGFLRPKGTIVGTYPAAANALDAPSHRVVPVRQDPADVGDRAWAVIRRLLGDRDL
jgi:uroporphyrinogen-III decarboxylase